MYQQFESQIVYFWLNVLIRVTNSFSIALQTTYANLAVHYQSTDTAFQPSRNRSGHEVKLFLRQLTTMVFNQKLCSQSVRSCYFFTVYLFTVSLHKFRFRVSRPRCSALPLKKRQQSIAVALCPIVI
ncbi:Hypothetical_protein [Hexamita inflata]|uniref:Hypothetical_protein n=1 Tax=Hexamita inflata TaxID=28002 RepID=A0AA86RJ47_9EUKA|nr:Hypothetical protein HINF_LOCUS63403 [Hexamita inflata]